MSLGIAATDRKLLLIGGTLFFLMLGASVVLAPPAEQFSSPIPSTYSTQSAGAEAAYLLLSRLRYPIRRWEDAPTQLPSRPDRILLILADPTQVPTERERNAVADFVRNGGHILFTGSNIQNFFPDADISSIPPDPNWKTFSPIIPSLISRGAPHITIQPEAYWGELNHTQLALYGEVASPAVVAWSFGKGEILWWAGSTPLTNAGITRDDDVTFFLNAVSRWPPDEPYQIYWDEYFHGQRSSLWSYARRPSLASGLAQIGFLAVAVIFTFSRRSGPVYVPPGVSRLSPLEFVDTLGGLYERTGAASAAVSVSLQRLRFLLARQLGLPIDTPSAKLAQAAEERLGWKNFQLPDLLGRAENASRASKTPPRQALPLIQDLERRAEDLEPRARFHREKP